VPYRGVDEWVRIALISSGVMLTGAAALIAFWPRPKARATGHPIAAAVALGALYTIPIVEHGPKAPYLGGAVFCMLLAAFLYLERLRADQLGVGVGVRARGDRGRRARRAAPRRSLAWLDYEHIAEDLQPEKAATFSWNHSYGPMTWPRDGREVLRVQALAPDVLEDRQPRRVRRAALDRLDPGRLGRRHGDPPREWIETIRVVDRGVRTRQFVGRGHTLNVLRGGPGPCRSSPARSRPRQAARARSSYQARVYVPRATDRQLRDGRDALSAVRDNYLALDLPRTPSRTDARAVRFATYGSHRPAGADYRNGFQAGGGAQAIRASAYARMYALAQALKAQTKTPFAFVQAVLQRCQTGATYSETPPPARVPLMDFMFGNRLGYCQQFSGSMAMLLRMGGVPARVASGFSPGRFDRKRTSSSSVTTTPTRGSRPTSPASAGRPSTRRRLRRPPARSSPTPARRARHRPRSARTSASVRRATARRSPATRARGSPRRTA
jgi:hypothetical protein